MRLDTGVFRDLLVLCINNNNVKVEALAVRLIDLYEESVAAIDPTEVKYINVYVNLVKDVLGQVLTIEHNRGAILGLLNKYAASKVFRRDNIFKEALLAVIGDKVTEKQLLDLMDTLNSTVAWHCANRHISQLYGAVKDAGHAVGPDDRANALDNIRSMIGEFKEEFVDASVSVGRGGPIESIDFSSMDSIDAALKESREITEASILKPGLQMMGQLLGEAKGFKRGDSHVFAARLHNFKSGMLLKVLQWMILHNEATPPEENEDRKQAIIFISLENTCHMNMMKMFRELYYNLTGVSGANLTDEDIQKYVFDLFNKSGYSVFMERYLASTFGYSELVQLIEKYHANGYEVVGLLVDYLTKMKKDQGRYSREGSHAQVRVLYEEVCDFCKASRIAMFTGAQLNRKASEVVAAGGRNLVKKFNDEMFAESLDIPRVVDFIGYINVERDAQGFSWMTFLWGKHRYVENTPETHKYFAYKFHPLGGIVDDIEGECMGVRDIYAGSGNTQEAIASGDISELLG